MTAALLRTIGWLTIAGAVIMIVSLVFLIMFFSRGEPYGTLNDITSVLLVLLMLPVLIFFLNMLRSTDPTLTIGATAIGVLGIAVTSIVQTMLIARLMPYEQTVAPNMIGGGMIGAWLIVINWLARQRDLESGVLPWFGIAAGIGYVLLVIGFTLGGQDHPLFQAGGGLTVLAYPIWLGVLLINGKITPASP